MTVRASSVVSAPVATLYRLLVDYAKAPAFIDGLDHIVPTGPVTSGVGARFDASMRVGPTRFEVVVELAEAAESASGATVVWALSKESATRLRFDISPYGPGASSVEVAISYEPPGGLKGVVLAPVVERTVSTRARAALGGLKRLVRETS